MAKLTGNTIASSYDQLLIVDHADGISASLQAIESADTGGSASSLKISTSKCEIIPASNSTALFEVSQADGTAVLSVDTTNAMIGIGEGTPTGMLHISSTAAGIYEAIIIDSTANDNLYPRIQFLCNDTTNAKNNAAGYFEWKTGSTVRKVAGQLYRNGQNTAAEYGIASTYDITSTDPWFYIKDGDVGIGIAVPANQLHIKSANPSMMLERTDAGAIAIYFRDTAANSGAITYDHADNSLAFRTDGVDDVLKIQSNGDIDPGADGTQDLGSAALSYEGLWISDASVNTSDERIKENIEDSVLGLDFVNRLRPVSFKKKDKEYILNKEDENGNSYEETHTKTYKRTHYGLIAQEVKGVLDDLSIDTEKFAGYVDGNLDEKLAVDKLFLRYTEFIAPMMKAIQELSAKVEALENA